jgi:hypothetical protein
MAFFIRTVSTEVDKLERRMDNEFTTVRISRSARRLLARLAKRAKRSSTAQLDLIVLAAFQQEARIDEKEAAQLGQVEIEEEAES